MRREEGVVLGKWPHFFSVKYKVRSLAERAGEKVAMGDLKRMKRFVIIVSGVWESRSILEI